MDGVIDKPETEDLSEGQQVLLDLLKEKHGLADDRTFAMWLTVPFMRSRQKWVLAAVVASAILVSLLVFVAGSPVWLFACPAVGLVAFILLAERNVLSLGPGGLMLHKPENSSLDSSNVVAMERAGAKVTVDGVDYRADTMALDALDRLSA